MNRQDRVLNTARTKAKRYDKAMKCLLFGVVNVTPDSFSDGGKYLDPAAAIQHALGLIAGGADVLDIGGESTSFHRAGVRPVEPEEQIRRVVPVIVGVRARSQIPISIDTRLVPVARAALDAGATLVNDVSAGLDDPGMFALVAQRGRELLLMHRQEETPDVVPQYRSVVAEVAQFLNERVQAAEQAGISRERLWVDPGLGFGKTVEHNIALLRSLETVRPAGTRLLIGASRKRFVGHLSGEEKPADRLGGSLSAALWAVLHGADGLRVHDVAQTAGALRVWQALAGEGK